MWAIRRSSIHLRNRCLSLETSRICSVKSAAESCHFDDFITEFTQSQVKRRYHSRCSFHYSNSSRLISSLAGDEKVVLEDSSSRHDDDSISESDDLSVDVLKGETSEKKSPQNEAISGMAQVILSNYGKEVAKALDEWVEAGNEVTPTEVSSAVIFLQRRRLFNKALEMYEWLESREKIEFTESEYACRVDLIAKVQGLFKAEEYIREIPESFRTEVVYRNLLRNCVRAQNVYKSEKLFNQMRGLFHLTVISCNQMLFLYMRTDPKKIAYIMEFMEKKSIKPSNITYQILIDVNGHSGNISEMEEILETMKSNGMEPNLNSRKSMAEYYAASGLKDKAEAVLKDMEGGDLVKNRVACCYLLLAYASLGRDDEVGRIWRECESDPSLGECVAAMKAWGQLKRIEDAEAALDKASKIIGMPSSKHYAVLLNVYAGHKMVSEGEDLFRRLRESGVNIRVHAWDALVKLYVCVGQVEKADAVLEEAIQQRKGRPSFASFTKILELYAARGNVQNAEKIFLYMRKAGYVTRPRPYHSLLYAYINAKTPALGFDQRLRRDNVVPDSKLVRLLTRVASFQSPVG